MLIAHRNVAWMPNIPHMDKKIPRIWIDTDIALGTPRGAPKRDVDDGWAVATVLMAAARGWVEVVGISVCDGNTDAHTAFQCMQSLLKVSGMGMLNVVERDGAAQSMARLHSGVTLLALGPLTQVAQAMRINPALPRSVALVSVGGVLNSWNIRRCLSDLNVLRDPAAAAAVHGAFVNCRRMPLDVIDRFILDAKRMRYFAASGAVGSYLASHSQRWLGGALWRHGRRAFPVWDLVAALVVLDALPGARFDACQRLIDFDVEEAWQVVTSLLVEPPTTT